MKRPTKRFWTEVRDMVTGESFRPGIDPTPQWAAEVEPPEGWKRVSGGLSRVADPA